MGVIEKSTPNHIGVKKSTPNHIGVSPLRAEIFNFKYCRPNIKPNCIGGAAVSEYTQASSSSPNLTILEGNFFFFSDAKSD
jgi:hypothetical protein